MPEPSDAGVAALMPSGVMGAAGVRGYWLDTDIGAMPEPPGMARPSAEMAAGVAGATPCKPRGDGEGGT